MYLCIILLLGIHEHMAWNKQMPCQSSLCLQHVALVQALTPSAKEARFEATTTHLQSISDTNIDSLQDLKVEI